MDDHYKIAIPFRDIDMHGHMHNAAHVSHFEAAISHFIRVADLAEHFAPNGPYVYHVRKVEVEFHAPSRYDDDIKILCSIGHLGRTSLTFAPQMLGADGALRATAKITWVCVDREQSVAVALPSDLRSLLEPHIISQNQ